MLHFYTVTGHVLQHHIGIVSYARTFSNQDDCGNKMLMICN